MNISLDETKINEIRTLLGPLTKNLLDALESNNQAQALIVQQVFTDAITTLWNTMEESGVDPKIKAIPRLIVGWAMTELPNQIQDPANNAAIKRELKLFQRSLMMFS